MTKGSSPAVLDVVSEFGGASLGDARLDERLQRIVARMAAAPGDSFPEQMATVADREALYRFLANSKVAWSEVLNGHLQQTVARSATHGGTVRVLHDTTTFRFSGVRDGLGIVTGGALGFLAHVSLAVGGEASRVPLGVLGVRPFIHADTVARRRLTRAERIADTKLLPRAARESARWEQGALAAAGRLGPGVSAVHVMDQEADDYTVFATLSRAGVRFVIRVRPGRLTADTQGIAAVLAAQPATVLRTVHLSARSPRQARACRPNHPPRAERPARLGVRWGAITLRRSAYHADREATLTLHAVQVQEIAPPPGEEPIEWMLVTTDPIDSLEAATAVVDHYCARWLIEEYFKALKTGCAFEKRQLTSLEGLLRALALHVPMAWRLLALRQLGRAPDSPPASALFEHTQVELLRRLLGRRRITLVAQPSVRDALWGIAALGGHITNNGEPGWLVLGRGYARFCEAELGWRLARGEM